VGLNGMAVHLVRIDCVGF